MQLGKPVTPADPDFFDILFKAGEDLAALGATPPIEDDEANERLVTKDDVKS